MKSLEKSQKLLFTERCEDGRFVMCFNVTKNVTVESEDAAKLWKQLTNHMGGNLLNWTRLSKAGTIAGSGAIPAEGVGISQIECPFLNDAQVTLNFTSLDGAVVSARICRNGQDRDAWTKEAKRWV